MRIRDEGMDLMRKREMEEDDEEGGGMPVVDLMMELVKTR